ncbi:HNH endonuclease [Staphylococcus phage PG-2021_1]
MEKLDKPIILENGTTFTHKEKINNRWYYIGYCGICNEGYKVRTSDIDNKSNVIKCHSKCKGNGRELPNYIENDTPMYKHINEELWHNILGFPGYWVNRKGEILGRKGKKLKLGKSTKGYPQIFLKTKQVKKGFRIHRLVAQYFIYNDNPEQKNQVNHIDGNKLNNNVENLEWCSNKENHEHKMRNNLNVALKGSEHHNSVLTEQDVIDIFKSKEPYNKLIKKYNISKSTISSIKCGRNWNHITKEIK